MDLKNINSREVEHSKNISDYEREVEIVSKLAATVGAKLNRSAYFEGKNEVLESNVDNVMGKSPFREIKDVLYNKDYAKASAVIENYDKNEK